MQSGCLVAMTTQPTSAQATTTQAMTTHATTAEHVADGTATVLHQSRATPQLADVERTIAKRAFCTLATVSPAGYPHAAGVIYVAVDEHLWISVERTSRKARNIAANPRVHVNVPVRRVPIGPPSSVHFAATAEIFPSDDPTVRQLADDGRIDAITGHGELDLPGGCFARITPANVLHTYGLGLPLRTLIRDPLHAAGRVQRAT